MSILGVFLLCLCFVLLSILIFNLAVVFYATIRTKDIIKNQNTLNSLFLTNSTKISLQSFDIKIDDIDMMGVKKTLSLMGYDEWMSYVIVDTGVLLWGGFHHNGSAAVVFYHPILGSWFEVFVKI